MQKSRVVRGKSGDNLVKGTQPLEEKLRQANASLSRCKLVKHGERLYVRSSHFPPKPRSRSARPELATGYRATGKELPLALGMASEIDGQLLRERFNWADWLKVKEGPAVTVRDWLNRLEADYWQRRERTLKAETTWQHSYYEYFQHLPLEVPLTLEVLKLTLRRYKAGSRSRQLCSVALGMLAEFAGVDRSELRELGKGYKSAAKSGADILTDEQIVFQIEQCRSRAWQCAAAIQATFGLRNHEIFRLDTTRLTDGVVRVLPDAKTGERMVYACPFEWIEQFRLNHLTLPAVVTEGRANRDIGNSVTKAYKRQGLAHPYAYRDAYAIRLEFYWDVSTPGAFKTRWMGHSAAVHDANYLDAIQEIHHERMYEKLRDKSNRQY